MELNVSQIEAFEQRGYLFFPGLLDTKEVGVLQKSMAAVLSRQGPEVVREKDDVQAARLVFGAHVFSAPFGALALLPRLLKPVRRLLRDEVYLHQSRLNPKQGFDSGAQWDWHQDFPPWHTIDGMPEPHCIMAAVFVDECSAVSAPLLLVPGSHRHGLLASKPHQDTQGRGYALHHIDRPTLKRLADEHGIEALVGPAGSVCFIHCNLVHGSANNVSPWRRAIFYLNYNRVSNACTGTARDWYHNNRDFTPLQPGADDGLRRLAFLKQ